MHELQPLAGLAARLDKGAGVRRLTHRHTELKASAELGCARFPMHKGAWVRLFTACAKLPLLCSTHHPLVPRFSPLTPRLFPTHSSPFS